MRYHYDKPDHYTSMYGRTYICDHPVYSHCTLYKIGEKGLAVIQQRYIPETRNKSSQSSKELHQASLEWVKTSPIS